MHKEAYYNFSETNLGEETSTLIFLFLTIKSEKISICWYLVFHSMYIVLFYIWIRFNDAMSNTLKVFSTLGS